MPRKKKELSSADIDAQIKALLAQKEDLRKVEAEAERQRKAREAEKRKSDILSHAKKLGELTHKLGIATAIHDGQINQADLEAALLGLLNRKITPAELGPEVMQPAVPVQAMPADTPVPVLDTPAYP